MAEGGSLLLDAKRLTAKARVKRDNAAGVQADGQFATALNKLTVQFSRTGDAVGSTTPNWARPGSRSGPVPDLTRAADKLRPRSPTSDARRRNS